MRTTPRHVAFNDTEFMVGIEAKNYFCEDPRNTVNDTKRFIGRLFHDEIIQKHMKTGLLK
ncbi:heat shock protein 70-like protein, partial [Leptotrombidium deliense]